MLNELRINNIFHNDIKASNIVVDVATFEVFLIDFGTI